MPSPHPLQELPPCLRGEPGIHPASKSGRPRPSAHLLQRAGAPALLLPVLLRHPEKEAALALGAEQLAPAVVGEVGDVELILICGRSRKLRAHKSPWSQSAGGLSHTPVCVYTPTHMHTHSLTCQPVPEVGQADLLGAIEKQGALWVQGSHLRQQAQRSRHAAPPQSSPRSLGRPSPF